MKQSDIKKDYYRNLAHKLGYRSRAAFKLIEINNTYKIIKKNFYVLDLGCAPGGWVQVAVRIVGEKGKIMGVDLSDVKKVPGMYFLKKNIQSEPIIGDVFEYFGKKVDTVICDISPKVIGTWSLDHMRQISLNYICAKVMDSVLCKKGNALFKVFDGEYSSQFRNYLKQKFVKFKVTKPKSSRKSSSEIYCICIGYLR